MAGKQALVVVEIEYSRGMRQLMSGGWINAHTLGYIAGEVLKETVGPGKIQQQHFNAGQSRWPRLAQSTLRSRGKKSPRTFYHSGAVYRAISQSVSGGKVLQWGSSADIHATGERKHRFSANGLYASMRANSAGVVMTVGFSGTLKHSKEFRNARKKLAAERGHDVVGRGAEKRIKRAVSVADTAAYMRKNKIKGQKYAAMGSLGFRGGKHVLARGKDNLAYANIVQAGPFQGVRDNDSGLFYNAKILPRHRAKIGSDYSEVRGKKPRPLLPYVAADAQAVQSAIERAAQRILDNIGR